MRERQLQMRDAGFKVIEETIDRRGQHWLPGADQLLAQQLGQRGAGGGVGAPGLRLEFTPAIRRYLGFEIAHAMRETPLTQTLRPALLVCRVLLEKTNAGDEDRIAKPPGV